MSKKSTYKKIKDYIESFEYQLLSDTYKNSKQKLSIKCPQGHLFEMAYNTFQQGHRCPVCNNINRKSRNKHTYQKVKNYIESFDHKLLSEEYKNIRTKLSIKCPQGHLFEMKYNDFQQGHRCPVCNNKDKKNRVKYTYKQIKEHIESFGYQLLSEEYKNVKTTLKIKCPKGHIYETNFSYFKSGSRCPECGGTKKLTYKEIKEHIESFGYQLLSNTYKNAHSNIKIKCPEGHTYEVKYYNFKNGYRCPYCQGNAKLDYQQIKEHIESFGYKLLSNTYKNVYTKLEIQCPEGHIYKANYHNFKNGSRCPYCYGNAKLDYKEIKEYIESFGYKLLSNKYEGIENKIKVECPEGHIYKVNYSSFKNGSRCPYCYGNAKLDMEYVRKYIEFFGYQLLSEEYKNTRAKIKVQCPEEHIYETTFSRFRNGNRCPICWKNSYSSNMERELQNFVKSIYKGLIINNDRNTIKNPYTGRYLELDMYFPEIKAGIEFNGGYWHSFFDKMKRDKIKKEQCKRNNINLLVIEEENWLDNKEICLQAIENFLNNNIEI